MSTLTERKISIYSSRGNKATSLTTNVATWGELLPLINGLGYPVTELHASESVTKTTLEHVDAVLPVGEFTLFMRPKKTKSGASKKRGTGLDKKGLVALVKKDTASFPAQAKAYYSGYSSMKTDALAALVGVFKGKVVKAPVVKTPAKTTPAVKKAVSKVVESVKGSKKPASTEVVESQGDFEKRMAKEAADFERGLK